MDKIFFTGMAIAILLCIGIIILTGKVEKQDATCNHDHKNYFVLVTSKRTKEVVNDFHVCGFRYADGKLRAFVRGGGEIVVDLAELDAVVGIDPPMSGGFLERS